MSDPRATDILISLLKEGYYETTLVAAQFLAAIGEPAVIPLLAALGEMHGIGLRDAILALGWIGDARALPALESLRQKDDVIEEIHTTEGVVRENVARRACEMIEKTRAYLPRSTN